MPRLMQTSDQQQAIATFVEAQRLLIESQRVHIADQVALIAQLQQQLGQTQMEKANVQEALERAQTYEVAVLDTI